MKILMQNVSVTVNTPILIVTLDFIILLIIFFDECSNGMTNKNDEVEFKSTVENDYRSSLETKAFCFVFS